MREGLLEIIKLGLDIMKNSASNGVLDLAGYTIRSPHSKYMKSSPRSGSSSGQHRKNRLRYLKLFVSAQTCEKNFFFSESF